MLGDSSSVQATTTTAPSGGGAAGGGREAPPLISGHHEGGSSEVGGEEDKGIGIEGDRSFGGNRWPRQETLALLKIRSDMDVAFRDASVKGPLWEEVSRKLAALGYNRTAKKCKEKFENVYKYHKRTKEGRTSKQDQGKTYRFFDQLEAFENQTSSLPSPLPAPPKPQTPVVTAVTTPVAIAPPTNLISAAHNTVPSTAATATLASNMSQGIATPAANHAVPSFPPTNPTLFPPSQATNPTNPPPQPNIPTSFPNFSSDLISNSTSSSTSSDVELQGRHKRKRKWKDFFERLMTETIQKQEDMQKKFLEAIEKREHERMVREDSWRMQEMARINREREILAQERSMAATKDAAVMAFLQKLSEKQNNAGQPQNSPVPQLQPPPPPAPSPTQPVPIATTPPPPPPVAALAQAPQLPQPVTNLDIRKSDNGDRNFMPTSSSRWPKVEVEALINLRTNLDSKYLDNGPKGPLWEEISGGMRKIGYDRSAKRCKEKWENINKYFKKVKESNKKRPDDSKTCPYFHQLDALYKERNKNEPGPSTSSATIQLNPGNLVPLMVRPEQQWPPAQQEHGSDSAMEDMESDGHQNHDEDDDDDKDVDDEDEDEASGYEIVANKQTSMDTAG